MGRYLNRELLEPVLNRGRSIEVFIGGGVVDGDPTIRWAAVRCEGEAYLAQLWEAWDPRDPAWLDVSTFRTTTVEPDEPIDTRTFSDLAGAIACVVTEWGAAEDRFVNEGVIASEYRDYLARELGG